MLHDRKNAKIFSREEYLSTYSSGGINDDPHCLLSIWQYSPDDRNYELNIIGNDDDTPYKTSTIDHKIINEAILYNDINVGRSFDIFNALHNSTNETIRKVFWVKKNERREKEKYIQL